MPAKSNTPPSSTRHWSKQTDWHDRNNTKSLTRRNLVWSIRWQEAASGALLQNLEISEGFKLQGGTELGCISTSTSKEIVAGDANADQPLVFRVVSGLFMSCLFDVSWLSVYPAEKEILYPPLTYLEYGSTTPIPNSSGVVVDVPPFSTQHSVLLRAIWLPKNK
jgi:hypothetical protein